MHLFQDSTIKKRRCKNLGSVAPAKSVAAIIRERLIDVKRNFTRGVAIGAFCETQGFMIKTDSWMMIDSSFQRLKKFAPKGTAICAKEDLLPLEVESTDLCISYLTMHRMNNLHIHVEQIRHVLKPGGLFLAALLGGNTLIELRDSFMEGEVASTGAGAMRVGPFIDLANGMNLLQNAGFHMCIGDKEHYTFYYSSMEEICAHIRNAGENRLIAAKAPPISPSILHHAKEYYTQHHSEPQGLKTTFEVLFLSGWRN